MTTDQTTTSQQPVSPQPVPQRQVPQRQVSQHPAQQAAPKQPAAQQQASQSPVSQSPGSPSQPPLRADARRNREQLIAAASRIFSENGPHAAMEEIARAAGVGIGTLYRRFPDRTALILAVAVDNYSRAAEQAKQARREEASAWDVLVRLVRTARELRLSVHLALISPKVSEIVEADPEAARCRNELLGLLDEVVREAKQEGSLRPDVGAGDVTMLVALLLREMPNFAGEAASPGVERRELLLLDGLRA